MNPVISEILDNKYCKDCILSERKNFIIVRDETLKLNVAYVPKNKISILFVAESPPMEFLEDRTQYFYAPGSIKNRGLFYNTMSVLFEEEMKEYKKYLLKKFLKQFYLIDMVKCPINKLSKTEKTKAIKSCSIYLNKELHFLDFQKAIFIGKDSFKKVRRYLDLDFDYAVIPFPRFKKNVQDFRKGLTALL